MIERPPSTDPGIDLRRFAEDLSTLAERRLALGGGSPSARRRAHQLRDHLAGHVLPRSRSLDAPLAVLLVGPTGAGKSSLLNTIAGWPASRVGVLRPTTREVVVLVRPSDRHALLGPGSALEAIGPDRVSVVVDESGRDGVAILDAPDVDSIDHANRELADRLAEVADLGVFVTTATRYADEVPWGVLDRLRERGLPLVVVANRLPADPEDRAIVVDDLRRLISEHGMDELAIDGRFRGGELAEAGANGRAGDRNGAGNGHEPLLEIVPVTEGAIDAAGTGLDPAAVRPLLDRLDRLAADRDARRALATRALAGSLAGLGPLLDAIGDDLEHEAIDAEALRRSATDAFQAELSRLRDDVASGGFLRAEALRQWHAFVGADEVTRLFSSGIGKVRGTVAAILGGGARAPIAEVRDETLADLRALARVRVAEAIRRTAAAWSDSDRTREALEADSGLWTPSPDFDAGLERALDGWMTSIGEDVRATGAPKRRLARGASAGINATGVAVMLATFAHTGGLTGVEVGVAAGTAVLNQKLLEALFGEAALVEMIGRARRRLGDILTEAFRGEMARFERLTADPEDLRSLVASVREAAGSARRLPPTLSEHARPVIAEAAGALAWPEET